MIREEVMIWVGLGLLVLMAFVLIPAYEGFKNAEGKEVDVDPNAPAMPDWLKPLDESGGKTDDLSEFFDKIDSVYPGVTPSSSSTSSPSSTSTSSSSSTSSTTPSSTSTSSTTPSSTSTSSTTPSSTDPCRLFQDAVISKCGFNNTIKGNSTECINAKTALTKCIDEKSASPAPSTQGSDKPSGVTTLPSQSMPPKAGDPISLPDSKTQVLDMTLPPPNYGSYGPGGGGVHGGDKYVLKTSLQPCACAMGGPGKVPGGMDSWPPTGDDAIKRPSGFQSGGNDPVGYLNSFSSFMR